MTSKLKSALFLLLLLALGWLIWQPTQQQGLGPGFVSGNGRLEATEINIATPFAGRLAEVLVSEGEWVATGQVLARMQLDGLQAQQQEARARLLQAQQNLNGMQAQLDLRRNEQQALLALVAQKQAELDAIQQRLARSEALAPSGALSAQQLDDERARQRSAAAGLKATQAQQQAAQAAIQFALSQQASTQASVQAAEASLARITVDLANGELSAPRKGRVQFRIAQAGEVLAAGGRVLNMVDLSEVYISFFVPETVAGQVALGSEVRIVLDAMPNQPIPAKVSFVSSVAQFTPKTVETASERQKLMFRLRAQLDPTWLAEHAEQVKTGVPGVAWLKLDPKAAWPASLNSGL